MTTYDLGRLNILVVDDNQYIRGVLSNVLKTLGVGEVLTAENGVEAIETMKASGDPMGRPIDIVITDLIMAPIDGMLLLKWIRQGRDSPNRFTPVIMMSGAADKDLVEASRDQGANEFLAKPFSAASVTDRLLELLNRPRQFVATRTYFGPDRKRKRSDVVVERRNMTEKDATVVYSTNKVVRPKEDGDVYFFKLPNGLKEKAGGLGALGPGTLALERLEEADNNLKREALEFHHWAADYLGTLSKLCERSLQIPEEMRRKHFQNINLLAHELRGQGGTFGYPLITEVGYMLYCLTKAPCPTEDRAVTVVKAHIDTMHTVFRNQIDGDGGPVGKELISVLRAAIARYRLGHDIRPEAESDEASVEETTVSHFRDRRTPDPMVDWQRAATG